MFEEGVCIAMCALWVQKRIKGRDFWREVNDRETLNELGYLQQRESDLGRLHFQTRDKAVELSEAAERMPVTEQSFDRKLGLVKVATGMNDLAARAKRAYDGWFGEAVCERTGLSHRQIRSNRGEPFSPLSEMQQHGYYVLHMQFRDADGGGKGSGHSVAVHFGSDKVWRFLDPNYGEVAFKNGNDLQNFFRSDYQKLYADDMGTLHHMTVDHFPVPDQIVDFLEVSPEAAPTATASAAAASGSPDHS